MSKEEEEEEVVELGRPMDSSENDLVGGMALMEMEVEVDEEGNVQVVGEGEGNCGGEDDDEWEEGSEDEGDIWRLGIAEDPEVPEALKPEYFPSKVGGAPAWLDRSQLPSADDLRCTANVRGDECGKQLAFICQVYAPPPDEIEEAFHRTVFLFACRNPLCCGKPGSVRAFRSQLGRRNDFYAYEAPDYPTGGAKVEDFSDDPPAVEDDMSDAAVCAAVEAKKVANDDFAAGKISEAAAGYTKAAELLDVHAKWSPGGKIAGEYAKIRANRAECRLQAGDHVGAIDDCDAALKADAAFVKALYRRAKGRQGLHRGGGGAACGALQAAKEDLERALELDEDCTPARVMLKEVEVSLEGEFGFKEKELLIEDEPDQDEAELDPKRIEERQHIAEMLERYNAEANKELKEDAERMLNDDKEKKKDPRDKVDSTYLR